MDKYSLWRKSDEYLEELGKIFKLICKSLRIEILTLYINGII